MGAFSALIREDATIEKRGTNPLSAILSSFVGEGPRSLTSHASVHNKLKATHPNIFRQNGLELHGFPALVGAQHGVHATIDGFYYRLPLANPNEQPPFQNIQVDGDVWYKKDDWHFVVQSTMLFPLSDGNWGLVQLDRLTNHVMASHGFQPQRPLTALEQQAVDIENAGGDPTALLSQLEAQPVQPFINPLSLGVHPPRTTLKLNYHRQDPFKGLLTV